MSAQSVVTALIVVACGAYTAWSLMPAALRAAIASVLLKLSWPEALAARLRKTASGATGCGCPGCDKNPAKQVVSAANPSLPPGEHAIRIHPRMKR